MATSNSIVTDPIQFDVETFDGRMMVLITVTDTTDPDFELKARVTPSQAEDFVNSLREALIDLDVVR